MQIDKNFWEKYYKVYDKLLFLKPYNDLLEVLKESLKIKEGDTVLDAGGGSGNFAFAVKNLANEVILLDFSKTALSIYKKKNKNAICIYHDLTMKLPFSDNSIDKICCNNVLYSIENKLRFKVCGEFHRVLKKGGLIVVSNPKANSNQLRVVCSHFSDSVRKIGIPRSIIGILKLSFGLLQLAYYNLIITKNARQRSIFYFTRNEQENLLAKSGFEELKSFLVYAEQAILTIAKK